MFELEMNRKYLVKDSSHIGLLYYIMLEETDEDDVYLVYDYLYNDYYMLTSDELFSEFVFIK